MTGMPDLDIVIKALEICAAGTNSCEKCPMKDNCKGVSNAAMAAAIKLLKAQEAAVERIKAKIAEINPDVEGADGTEFDIGCLQGLRWALQELEKGSGEE